MTSVLPFTLGDVLRWKKEYPTPFYVYDADAISSCARRVNRAFSWNRGFREHYAVKACPTPGVLRLLAREGCGSDCASESEITLAEKSGLLPIIFSGNETSMDEYKAASRAGAVINLDDITQIRHMEEAIGIPKEVCCRYNPGSFTLSGSIIGQLSESKFGMTRDQIFEAFRTLRAKGVERFGLHGMFASSCLDASYYGKLSASLFVLAVEIKKKLGISVSFIDLSGGIGIPYRPGEKAVDIENASRSVREQYEKILVPEGLAPALRTEMGRFITGPYGYLVTTVIGEKHTYKDYLGVDATACCLMRPAMYGAYHHIVVLGKEKEKPARKYTVVGSLCENNDTFARDRELPEAGEGDILVIEDAGAHGRSMGYNYNGKMRPPEFLLLHDGSLCMIRRRETEADYFATLDIDPAFGG